MSKLERILYETTAINTMGTLLLHVRGGSITEFLGDGFLALFRDTGKKSLKSVYEAATECIRAVEEIVNPMLNSLYELPPLKVGVGMASSQAIVTVMGHGDNLHAKALGQCVFRATKLSGGENEIMVDEELKQETEDYLDESYKFNLCPASFKFKHYKLRT